MNVGDTFRLPDGIGDHINCVLKILPDGSLITCHFTSLNKRSDKSCVMHAGEHSSITGDTVVRYDQVQHLCTEESIAAFERLIWKRFEPLSADLLLRIIKGALDSSQTSDKIKDFLR